MTNQDIAVREEFALPAQARADAQLAEIEVFQKLVHNRLKDGHDYGVIPGTGNKATLLKPGAEKIVKLARCYPEYIVLKEVEDWDREPQPLFAYTIQCKIIYIPTGEVVDNGLGECNSMESKYRWRQGERLCPQCGEPAIIKGKAQYGGGWLCFRKKNGCGTKFNDDDTAITSQSTERVLNPDIADLNNTILKMAKKRALVDAALSLGSLSDLFTQDMEDIRPEAPADVHSSPVEPISEPDGTEQQVRAAGERAGKTQATHEQMTGEPLLPDTESDGGPAKGRFIGGGPESDEQAAAFAALAAEGTPIEPTLRKFTNMGVWKTALKQDFGLDTAAKIEAILEKVGLPPMATVGNFAEAYDTIAHHFTEQRGSDATS